MNNKKYMLNTLLAFVLGAFLLTQVLVRTFAPRIILFELDIPMLVLLSLVTLVLDHYLAPGAERCYICIPVFSALTFGLLAFGAFLGIAEALKLAIAGGVIFTAMTWLFSSVQDRISTGPDAKAAPIVSAFCLYLAFQALMGMIL